MRVVVDLAIGALKFGGDDLASDRDAAWTTTCGVRHRRDLPYFPRTAYACRTSHQRPRTTRNMPVTDAKIRLTTAANVKTRRPASQRLLRILFQSTFRLPFGYLSCSR